MAAKPQQTSPEPENKRCPVALRLPLCSMRAWRRLKPNVINVQSKVGRRTIFRALIVAAHEQRRRIRLVGHLFTHGGTTIIGRRLARTRALRTHKGRRRALARKRRSTNDAAAHVATARVLAQHGPFPLLSALLLAALLGLVFLLLDALVFLKLAACFANVDAADARLDLAPRAEAEGSLEAGAER